MSVDSSVKAKAGGRREGRKGKLGSLITIPIVIASTLFFRGCTALLIHFTFGSVIPTREEPNESVDRPSLKCGDKCKVIHGLSVVNNR